MSAQYRIEFQVIEVSGDDDGREIGFGSSSTWANYRSAMHEVKSMLDNEEFETSLSDAEFERALELLKGDDQ